MINDYDQNYSDSKMSLEDLNNSFFSENQMRAEVIKYKNRVSMNFYKTRLEESIQYEFHAFSVTNKVLNKVLNELMDRDILNEFFNTINWQFTENDKKNVWRYLLRTPNLRNTYGRFLMYVGVCNRVVTCEKLLFEEMNEISDFRQFFDKDPENIDQELFRDMILKNKRFLLRFF